jgi:flagellar hook protein FlgE
VPSISDGLFAGRAGIQSHGTAISVLADNIANQNTVGFKQSRADFVDLLAGTIGGGSGAGSTGSGSAVVSITPNLIQGSFESTGRGLDAGVDGNGMFIVNDPNTGQRFYTRAGNFQVDPEGNLLDQNGFGVQGFPANGGGGLEALNVNVQATGDVDTSAITITGNLDPGQPDDVSPQVATPIAGFVTVPNPAGGIEVAGQTFATLSDQADFQTSVDVFDSLGASHTVTTFFYHSTLGDASVPQNSVWTVQSVVDGAEINGGTAGVPFQIGSAQIEFGSNGLRTNPPIAPAFDMQANPAWSSGAAAGDIGFNFNPFTQFASPSNIGSISQNGTGSGSVVGFSIGDDGTLSAQLDNGEVATIGTIALAIFANTEGLARLGNSLFAETSNSGEAVIGQPDTGTFGRLESGALELSNSDIASDFIKLISLQRGFQGSSRVITNIDDLLNEIINLA